MTAFQWATVAVQVVQAIGTLFVWLYVRAERREQVDSERFKKLEEKVASIQGELGAVPTRENIGRLHRRIDDMSKDVSQLVGASEAMSSQVTLIYQYLLDRRGGG